MVAFFHFVARMDKLTKPKSIAKLTNFSKPTKLLLAIIANHMDNNRR